MKKPDLFTIAAVAVTITLASACGSTDETIPIESSEMTSSSVLTEAVPSETASVLTNETTTGTDRETSGTAADGQASETGSDTTGSDAADASLHTATGTITSLKNVMFIVETEDGESYVFPIDETIPASMPKDLSIGDKVTVTYTGDYVEGNSFMGRITDITKVS